MVNEMRFGYDRISFNFVNVDINTPANGTEPINTGTTVGRFSERHDFRVRERGRNRHGRKPPPVYSPNPYWDFKTPFRI